jgi:uncharacterized protein YndB with AHSA1/START domain
MEKAQVSMPSDKEVKVTRSFKAPKALVYRAYTEAALMRRWCGGHPGWTMPVCEMDVRVAGTYRWRWQSNEDKTEFGFSGEYREVEPGARIVHTQRYDAGTTGIGMGSDDSLITVTFTESVGVTTVTTLMDFGSKETRDAAVATGMTDGMEQSYQSLEGVLSSTPNQPEGGRAQV